MIQRSGLTLPMGMTYVRLLCALAVMPWLVMIAVQSELWTIHVAASIVCFLLCVTDLLDGYYARRYGLVTREGAVLDQVSDKVFMATSLLALVAVGRIHMLWAMLVIVREMLMMGLREYSLLCGFRVPVQYAGKLKVTTQYVYLFLVILDVRRWLQYGWCLELGACGLMVSMTIFSAGYYYYESMRRVHASHTS